jgi:hypothetical protein
MTNFPGITGFTVCPDRRGEKGWQDPLIADVDKKRVVARPL